MTFNKIKATIVSIWETFKAQAPWMIGAMILGSLLTIAATRTDAQESNPNCAPYDVIVEGLAENWNEYPAFVGVNTADGASTVIFAAPDGSTWTAVIVADGIGCVVLAGDQSQAVALPAAGDPA